MKALKPLWLVVLLMLVTAGFGNEAEEANELDKSLLQSAAGGDLEKQRDSEPQPQSTKRVEKYVYKQTPQGELAMYVHFPKDWTANDKRPAIVFFFGGGWRVGTVKEFTPQAEYLAGRGMVTARADYRVKSRHGTTPDKCVEDAKSAVRWLRANASKLGIDPNRIAASGHSAGGHIAACTYTTKGLEAEGEDLSVSSKPNLLVFFNTGFDLSPNDSRYLGSKEMAIKISPIHNLSKDVPPTILFYGTEDRRHLLDGIEFIMKSKKLGTIAELYSAEGQSHNFSKKSPWLERTIYLMDKFLERYGYTQGEPTVKLPEGKVEMKKGYPISLQAKDTWGYTPLHRAARNGHKELVQVLIANGAEVNAKDRWDCTPLHYAPFNGRKELVEVLIANGSDVNAKDSWGGTPLFNAAHYGHKELAELLIANGADVNAKDRLGYTPLYEAVSNKHKDTIRVLVANGADVNFAPEGDYSPLHYAVWNDDIKLAELYVDHGAKCDLKDKNGWTAFEYAMGNREMVEMFIAKGAAVSDFHLAAWRGDLRRVKRFVEQGTNVNTKDNELKWTALHWAAFTGQEDVVEFLIAKGADVNAKDERGLTALRRACGKGHQEVVSLLIASGADVNAKYPDGRTPLHRAAEKGYKEVVELLIANGADVDVKTEKGQTAMSLAKKEGHSEIVELLRKHGSKE